MVHDVLLLWLYTYHGYTPPCIRSSTSSAVLPSYHPSRCSRPSTTSSALSLSGRARRARRRAARQGAPPLLWTRRRRRRRRRRWKPTHSSASPTSWPRYTCHTPTAPAAPTTSLTLLTLHTLPTSLTTSTLHTLPTPPTLPQTRDHFCSKLDHTELGITAKISALEMLIRKKDPELGQ